MIMTYVLLAFISGAVIGMMVGRILTVRQFAARVAELKSQVSSWQQMFK